ncbi:MAG: hypothetical protein HY527_09300 [Betaproteobacteria bacterium]|nr:hypothetical protein [Betaproteobacteria bacterium]
MRVLWRDHLRIGLGSKWLALAGYRRGLRPTPSAKEIVVVDSADASGPWQAAVDALPAALALWDRPRLDVTVVLSNHFVRYALLPWNATLKSEAEWLALARHRFSSVHGPLAEEWVVRVAETGGRESPRIASAIDQALLAAIEEGIAGAGASLVSVQPYLMAAFNRMRPMIGNASSWLVIEEPGRLTLALIQGGVWRAIRSRRRDDPRHLTLPEVLERESALLALEEPCTRVVIHTHLTVDTPMHGAYELYDVTPDAAAGDRELAMALE